MTAPYINVWDAPWGAACDGISDDSAAIQSAIDAMALAGGGTLYLGRKHLLGSQLKVPASVSVEGSGSYSSTLFWGGSGTGRNGFALVAGNMVLGSGLAYGIRLANFGIQLTANGSHGICLSETCAAVVHNIYIEGVPNTNTSVGVMVDGGHTSNLFTELTTVICNHVLTGHHWSTNGTQKCTSINARNITSLGDNSAWSVGLTVDPGNALGSQVFGGNFEACEIGIYNAGFGTSFYGTRTEGCTYPTILVSGAKANLHFGCGSMTGSLIGSDPTNKFIDCTRNWNPGTPYP